MTSQKKSIRTNARRLVVFNHKGGVGKTTLTYNLAAAIADLGNRVLLVDTDPQCNLTSFIVEEDVIDYLLDNSDSEKGQTVWSALQPIVEATGDVRRVKPIEGAFKNLYLVPGDVRLSEFESELNDYWGQCLQRKAKGFRGTAALSNLVNKLTPNDTTGFDFVFYDSGPNIGPLNRAILLDCDYFIVPVAYDLFSVRALKTLGRTLAAWIREWQTIADFAPDGTYLLPGQPKFAGYIPQNFRVYGGAPTFQHLIYASKIDRRVQSEVIAVLRSLNPELASRPASQSKLGEVQNFVSLAPASQGEGSPLWEVSAGSSQLRETARETFRSMAKRIVELTKNGA